MFRKFGGIRKKKEEDLSWFYYFYEFTPVFFYGPFLQPSSFISPPHRGRQLVTNLSSWEEPNLSAHVSSPLVFFHFQNRLSEQPRSRSEALSYIAVNI